MKNGKYRVLLVEDQTIPTQLFEHFIQMSERYELARSIECAAFAEVFALTRESSPFSSMKRLVLEHHS